ncbi:MAG: hypothetical protein RLZZ265_3344, partial [Verrucomicrobiota bacterium]
TAVLAVVAFRNSRRVAGGTGEVGFMGGNNVR